MAIGGQEFERAYFLANGIYPDYAWLTETIANPGTTAHKKLAKEQQAKRKDTERAFGRHLAKWHKLNTPTRT